MSAFSVAPEQDARTDRHPQPRRSPPSRSGAASFTIILVLLLLLVATDFVAYVGWTLEDGIEVSTAGSVGMAAGVLFSLIVGCGLMTLIFYSSRKGYDEPPVLIGSDPGPKRAIHPPND